MSHLLDDCRHVLDRAKKDFDSLYAEVVRFFQVDPIRVIVEDDPETGEKVVYTHKEVVLPRSWGNDVGRIMGEGRKALDYLVYALAVKGSGHDERRKTSFPISLKRESYYRRRNKRAETFRDGCLVGVEERWRERIDSFQPYQDGDRARVHPLALLSRVPNRDKHNLPHAAHIAFETPVGVVSTTGDGDVTGFKVRFHPKSRIVRVQAYLEDALTLSPGGLVVQPKVEMDERYALMVIFGDMPKAALDLRHVKGAIEYVAFVVRELEPAFEPTV